MTLPLNEALVFEPGEFVGKIEFACMHSFALALLPKQLKELQKKYPKLQVNFRLGHTEL